MALPEKYHYIELDRKLNIIKIHEFSDSLTDKQFVDLFSEEHYELASSLVEYDKSIDCDDGTKYFAKVIYVRPV